MKILCLSDLHRCSSAFFVTRAQDEKLQRVFRYTDPDIVLITGDVYEYNEQRSPYKDLARIFDDVPVICTLGNHEFFYRSVKDTLDYYTKMYNPKKYNVHYLDIVGKYKINNINFIGNVLWYDGSLKSFTDQIVGNFADKQWMDCTIKDFDWRSENQKCVKQIKDNIDKNCTNILCTHTVPHFELNMWNIDPSLFNAFSGMDDLLKDINVQYSVCGHTHRRTIGQVINDTMTINVGNDYTGPIEHFILEI